MKKLLYTLSALLLAGNAFSQAITLSSSPTISPGKVDSCAVPTPASLSSLPSLGTPATNMSWDLSNVTLQSSFVTYAYRAKTSGFSTAGFSDSTTYSVGTSAATSYKIWRNIQQGSGGVMIQGEEVLTRQAKSLAPVTGGSVDSIIIPTQVVSYATPLRIIKFPATMGTVWLDSTARNINFNLSVAAASLNNAPAQQRQKRFYIDSVVGWGRMKVPIAGKGASTWMAVLQVHHRDVMLDSFFINGSPASAAILTAIGTSQGQSTTVATTFFYRAGAYRPLIELVHSTPSHGSAASTFYIHAIDLQESVGVTGLSAAGDIRLYPNPARHDGMLHIDLPGSRKGGWSYSIISAEGRQAAAGSLAIAAGQHAADLRLPQALAAGTYFMTLTNGGGEPVVLPVVIE